MKCLFFSPAAGSGRPPSWIMGRGFKRKKKKKSQMESLKLLVSLNFFMKLVQRLCTTTVEPSFWYEKQIWPTNPPYPWILYAWILCFIAWLSPDYRVRDHEVQLVFTPTTRPSGTPAVAWLPPTKSQTPKPTVQKPLMGLELHVAIVKFAIQPNFQFLHSNFSNPFFYVKIH